MVKQKKDLQRSDFKHNFLKKIVMRFDFSGITVVEFDALLAKIKVLLKKEYNYIKMTTEFSTEMDFQIDDPEVVESEGLYAKDIKKQRVYVFHNAIQGIELRLSTVFAFITIDKTKYVDFAKYSPALLAVMDVLKKEIDFLNGERFGLRKINQCYLQDISLINNYFEREYYNLFLLNGTSNKLYTAKDCVERRGFNINLTRSVIQGQMNGQVMYQIVLDTDVYVLGEEKDILALANQRTMSEMNDLLFLLYTSVITETLSDKLQMDTFEDQKLLGVEQND